MDVNKKSNITLEKEISIWIRNKKWIYFCKKNANHKNEIQNPQFLLKAHLLNVICVSFISQNGLNVFGTH